MNGRLFALVLVSLVTLPSHVHATDFDSSTTTSNHGLNVYFNGGQSTKTFTVKKNSESDRSLNGTGLTGMVIDGGDRWILDIYGGNLAGSIRTDTGVEIRLNGCSVVLSVSGSAYSISGIIGGGGVKIVGPGTLHIDQPKTTYAISSGGGSPVGMTTIVSGACVAINNLNETSALHAPDGVRIDGSALHVNSEGYGIFIDKGPMTISKSIVTVISKKTALTIDGSLDVVCSSVHLGGGETADGLQIREGLSVSKSVFCSSGGRNGIGPNYNSNRYSAVFDNMIGAIVGGEIGLYQAIDVFVSGGASKLSIIGNAKGSTDGSRGNLNKRGQAVFSSYGSYATHLSTFFVSGGRVDLYAPGNYALVCGTNVVSGGELNVRADPGFGDFRTLYTVSGAALAAEAVAGSIAYGKDILFTDALLAQVLESFWTAGEASLSVDKAKPIAGICVNGMFSTGGQVNVTASETGLLVGGTGLSSGSTGFLSVEGGFISVQSDGVAIADRLASQSYTNQKDDDSLIWMSGGRLSAKGGLDGILTCGGLLMDGGTLEAAATGGYSAGTIPDDPGLAGYALSANNGFAIDGGSFVATKGDLRMEPTTSGRHGWAKVYSIDMTVPDAPADEPVAISDFVPSWYGVNDLYPIRGKLRFWVPAGNVSLKYAGETYSGAAGPPTTYTVKFSANGGTGFMANQTVSEGKWTKLSANKFTRPGYVFCGWARSGSGPVVYANAASVKNIASVGKTVTLYAVWAKKNYKVKFLANGGTGKMSAQEMTYGKAARLRANKFTRKGHVFIGWSRTKNGKKIYGNKQAVKNLTTTGATVNLYAKWAKKRYRVKFYANGGKGRMSAQKMAYGKTKRLKANKFKWKGHVFLGWAKTKKGSLVYKNKMAVKNLTKTGKTVKLYAKWGKKVVAKFNANGGTVTKTSKTTTAGRKLGLLPTPTRKNWNFEGWWTKETGGARVTASTIVKKAMTVYAHWSPIITLSLDPGDGTIAKSSLQCRTYFRNGSYYLDTSWCRKSDYRPSRDTFQFDTWYSKRTGGVRITNIAIQKPGFLELHARWKPVYRNLCFLGLLVPDECLAFRDGNNLGPLPTPTLAGHVFCGWWSEPDGHGIQIATSTIADKSLPDKVYAYWERVLTVEFFSNGSLSDSHEYRVGQPLGQLPTPNPPPDVREGEEWEFLGWWSEPGKKGARITSSTIADDSLPNRIYAAWMIHLYGSVGKTGGA